MIDCVSCMQFAIYAAYAARLETAFLADEVASARAVLQGVPSTPSFPPQSASTADVAGPATSQQVHGLICTELPKLQSVISYQITHHDRQQLRFPPAHAADFTSAR